MAVWFFTPPGARVFEFEEHELKAIWYESHGDARDVLRVGERPVPEPAAGELRVRVAWSGVNRSDVKRRARPNAQDADSPWFIPHMDGSGVVEKVGPDVDPKRVGERVWLHRSALRRQWGTAAEFTVVPQHQAVALPQQVSLQAGATLGVPLLTAHRALLGLGPVEGRTVLVHGGGGSVGFYAIQLARWAGARRVLATAGNEHTIAEALRAGADAVVDYRSEDLAEKVLELTDSEGVDHIIDVDFGANLPHTVRMLRLHGSIATFASLGNPTPQLPFYEIMPLNWRILFVALYGMPLDVQLQANEDVTRWLSSGQVQWPQMHEYAMEDAPAAHEHVESGRTGRALVRVSADLGV